LIKADAAGNSADAKVFADEIRRLRAAPQAEPAETSLAQDIGQGVGNLAAGALRGAGSIGATLMRPFDTATENQQRRQSMDDALQSMGAEPDSWMYKGGKLGGEIAGTAGAGGVLAQGITRLAPAAASAPRIAQVLEALKSGGFTLGGKASATLGGKAADVGIRALGGAASGGAQAGMIDPNEAGFGALIGGSLPVGVQAAGKVAGGVGNVVRYVNRPSEIKLANKLAQSLGMSVDDLSRAVTQTGPNMLPGYQPTVPQILQNPVTSQLQRTLKTAGANGLGDAERVQQGAFREALERVAPIDVTVQDAAARAGDAIKGFAVPARADASFNVRQAFDAVDPFGESALTLPIDEMKAAAGKYLGKGTFGTGSRANEAIATAERVGTQTLPGVAPLKATANNSQTLEKAVRAAGGIKGGSGELRDLGIKQSGTTGLVNNKTGQSADLLAAEMYRRGFITDADPATLFDALRNGSGRKLYANDQVESNVMQRMAESAMGEMPLDEVIPKAVPFSTVQNLRSSIGEAAEVARAKGANKEGAALEQMIKEIDARVNSGGAAGDFFPKDMADQYRAALNMHADKMNRFETGPQIGMFRKGADGQTAINGAEIPGKFFSGRRSQVEDMQAFKRLIGNREDLANELKRFATTEAASTGNVQGDLTSKYLKWLQSRSGASRELFTPNELATLKEVGKAVEKSIGAENLGRVSGSDTAQKLEALNNLGLLDSKVINILATKIPIVGSFTGPALAGLRETAGQTRNNALSKLLANPDDLVKALQPGTPQSNKLLEWMNKQGAIGSKAVPAIAAQ
jgi:hypothetical protein